MKRFRKFLWVGIALVLMVGCSNTKDGNTGADGNSDKAASKLKEVRFVAAGALYPEGPEPMAINMFAGALSYRMDTHPDLKESYTFRMLDKGMIFGTAEECLTGVSTGAMEMTFSAPQYFATLQPEWKLVGTPGVFDSWEHFLRTMETPEWQELQTELSEKHGVTILKWMMNAGDWYLFTKKGPIYSVADMKGQKIRIAGGGGFNLSLQNMGITPVSLPYTEVVTSLQTNMIDGLLTDMGSALLFYDLANLTEYCVPISWAIQPQCWVVNTDFWESLAENERQAMQDVFDRIDVSMYFNNIFEYFDQLWASNPDLEMVQLEPAAADKWIEVIKSGAKAEVSASRAEIIQAIERVR